MSVLFALVVAFILVGFVIWWLFIETEGAYLGRRIVIWLYDVYAGRYDRLVQHDTVQEHLQLAQPLLALLPDPAPLVLDVATGTGRVPLALCQHAAFEGHVIGLDLSRKMLQQAAHKSREEHFEDYITLLWADGQSLPFNDDTFDCVTFMEALEFMPYPEAALKELVRVLRPGGLLLTTLRIHDPWMPGRVWSQGKMQHQLEAAGVERIVFEPWQYDYMKVWAVKPGESAFIGVRPLEELLRCPMCEHVALHADGKVYQCQHCQARLSECDGILHYASA